MFDGQVARMANGGDRIDGWKAIGAYFGRDRTTAIRWAKERGLPVHALPGGKTRTVYALRGELDGWRTGAAIVEPFPLAVPPGLGRPPDAGFAAPRARRGRNQLALPIGAALVGLLLILFGPLASHTFAVPPDRSPALPTDTRLAQRYIEARDELAQRNAPAITHALAELRAIVAADPGFAPAEASLADGYLLAREFGTMDDAAAFPRAASAARRALQLDGRLASAQRALALIAYWWDHDPAASGVAFRRALAIDSDDALTHLWYANVLADNGDAKAAALEFAAVKLRQPGLPVMRIDEAWSIWSAGDDTRAEAMMVEVVRASPMLASAHDCLSMVALARGDLPGYAREVAARASLRKEQVLTSYARAIGSAVARDDRDALSLLMAARAETLQAGTSHEDEALAAFFQSALGRRPALLAILARADHRHVRWPGAGFRLHIARRWRTDAQVMRLLRDRAPPPIA